MRLLAHLLVRTFAVILICLVATTGWVLVDAHRSIGEATRTSGERVAQQLRGLYWQELLWRDGLTRYKLLPHPDWETLRTARVIAPGICVGLDAPGIEPGRLCNEAEGAYAPAPRWFAGLYTQLFGAFPTIGTPLDVRRDRIGTIVSTPDPDTALRLAWLEVALMMRSAGVMAAAIALLVATLLARTLLPVRSIIEGMRRLEAGDLSHRLGGRGRLELGRIASAFDHLAERLGETQAARAALTRRLFQVQEEERRALARDLHDEFGQCLAATGALAGSIAAGAADRPDLVADAQAISKTTRRMMGTLKDALVRLRSQDIDELGLEACLQELRETWSTRTATGTVVALETKGDLARVPRAVAISLYRIAQECLTNAARHGAARNISLKVEALSGGADTVSLCIEDDGGGDPARIGGGGHGLLGIRERIAALGGSLSIARAAQGIRVAASIPFCLPSAMGGLPSAMGAAAAA